MFEQELLPKDNGFLGISLSVRSDTSLGLFLATSSFNNKIISESQSRNGQNANSIIMFIS